MKRLLTPLLVCCLGLAIPGMGQDLADSSAVLYQSALEIQSDLVVLAVALEPGQEDVPALTYLRYGRGAQVQAVFLTNGEAGESDHRAELPVERAARSRKEAAEVLWSLGGEAYFLNMPDFGGAHDTARVHAYWPADSLLVGLMKIISRVKPDLIILTADSRDESQASLQFLAARDALLRAVEWLSPSRSVARNPLLPSFPLWPIGRVIVEEPASGGDNFPVDGTHPIWGVSYSEIARLILPRHARSYRPMAGDSASVRTYATVYPRSKKRSVGLDDGLPPSPGKRLAPLKRDLRLFGQLLQKRVRDGKPLDPVRDSYLGNTAILLDSLNYYLARRYELNATERKALLQWKQGVEEIRNQLLNVQVYLNFQSNVIVERQVTTFSIDTILGIRPGGTTEILVSKIGDGWVLNEALNPRIPVVFGETNRLISPTTVQYDHPPSLFGFPTDRYGDPFYIFVLHFATEQKYSFIYRITARLFYAPKFTAESLTPIVHIPGDTHLVVRLTNNSHDGVSDEVYVRDSLVTAQPRPFFLPKRGDTHTDTLSLRWSPNIQDGSYVFPIEIDEIEVGRFAARKVVAVAERGKRIVFVKGVENSVVGRSLQRLGLRFSTLTKEGDLRASISSADVVVIDQRALTLNKNLSGREEVLRGFAERGGHLVILSQDANVWNSNPLWNSITLNRTSVYDETVEVVTDTLHSFMQEPNRIAPEDWDNWLYFRTRNALTIHTDQSPEIPVKAAFDDTPLIVSESVGKGRITYVNLELDPQLENVHGGALRLLANIASD